MVVYGSGLVSRVVVRPVMPLSSEQKGMLKDPTTRVKFEQETPKSPRKQGLPTFMTSTREVPPFKMLHRMVLTGKISQSTLRRDGSSWRASRA